MKKVICLGFVIAIVMLLTSSVNAVPYIFTPISDHDLDDLDHHEAYAWGMDWNAKTGGASAASITSATLRINSIWDWRYDEVDYLYMHLLDWAEISPDVTSYSDNQSSGSYFNSAAYGGTETDFDIWSDPDGGNNGAYSHNLSFDFNASQLSTLKSYIGNDGRFGMGFDPDCHYYNCGVELEINTRPVIPEPATMLLFGLGLAGVAIRKRFNK